MIFSFQSSSANDISIIAPISKPIPRCNYKPVLQLGRRFLQGTFYGVEALILLIGVSCVGVMGSRRITCFFTVEKLLSCGAWFSDLLGFLGFCLDRLLTLFAAGGTGSENTLLGFGI